jgi:hypothetical protein
MGVDVPNAFRLDSGIAEGLIAWHAQALPMRVE